MGKGLTAYSGLTTKIRAMKKNILTEAEYDRINSFTSVADLLIYLQSLPAYSSVLSDITPELAHRGIIEQRLKFSSYRDFEKIYHFASVDQKKYLDIYFMSYEIDALKTCIRNILDSRDVFESINLSESFKKQASMDFDKVLSSRSIEDLIDSLSGSIYAKIIENAHSNPEATLFDYGLALDVSMFSYAWKKREDILSKRDLPLYTHSMGTRIDLLNILWIYRAKKYYNMSQSGILSIIIPANYKVDVSLTKKMVAAENLDSLCDLIEHSYYGKTYGFDRDYSVETQFEKILFDTYMSDFKNNPYSISAVLSYFQLKNLEHEKIVTAMECIRYGYGSDVIAEYFEHKKGVL